MAGGCQNSGPKGPPAFKGPKDKKGWRGGGCPKVRHSHPSLFPDVTGKSSDQGYPLAECLGSQQGASGEPPPHELRGKEPAVASPPPPRPWVCLGFWLSRAGAPPHLEPPSPPPSGCARPPPPAGSAWRSGKAPGASSEAAGERGRSHVRTGPGLAAAPGFSSQGSRKPRHSLASWVSRTPLPPFEALWPPQWGRRSSVFSQETQDLDTPPPKASIPLLRNPHGSRLLACIATLKHLHPLLFSLPRAAKPRVNCWIVGSHLRAAMFKASGPKAALPSSLLQMPLSCPAMGLTPAQLPWRGETSLGLS